MLHWLADPASHLQGEIVLILEYTDDFCPESIYGGRKVSENIISDFVRKTWTQNLTNCLKWCHLSQHCWGWRKWSLTDLCSSLLEANSSRLHWLWMDCSKYLPRIFLTFEWNENFPVNVFYRFKSNQIILSAVFTLLSKSANSYLIHWISKMSTVLPICIK